MRITPHLVHLMFHKSKKVTFQLAKFSQNLKLINFEKIRGTDLNVTTMVVCRFSNPHI